MKRNCHIRGSETANDNVAISTYGFTYDTQGRLTSSDRYNGAATSPTYLYTERNISYDRNGNILTLKRIANSIPNPQHDFTYSYDGDKLTTLSGSQSGTAFSSAYTYDGNGNMLLDGNQAVRLSYDLNNLVFKTRTIEQNQETLAGTYGYFADGTKFSLTGADGSGRLYIGPFTLARKEYTDATTGETSALTILESADAMGSDARFAFAATPQTINATDTTYTIAYETLYLIKDHLGSVRTITDSQGNALERNDYYPYGLATNLGRNYPALADKYRVRTPASFTDFSQNGNDYPTVSSPAGKILPFRLLYNGKELQLIAQTRLIDYGARQYDPTIARWNMMEPMTEQSMVISLFAYCTNNPISLYDVFGLYPRGVVYYDNKARGYRFTQAAAFLLSLTSGVSENSISQAIIISKKETGNLIPFYKDESGGGAITLGGLPLEKDLIIMTNNYFENPKTGLYPFHSYGNDIYEWLDLLSHEVRHINHINLFNNLTLYCTFLGISYLQARGHDNSFFEIDADIGQKTFEKFNDYTNIHYGYNYISKILESDMSETEKKQKIKESWTSFQSFAKQQFINQFSDISNVKEGTYRFNGKKWIRSSE